jgi:hypothetical protein
MRNLILLALILLLCSSGSLGQTNNATFDELITSALRSLVVDTSTNLESYRFTMEMNQKIDLVNISSNEIQTHYTRSLGVGMANMTEKALKLSMASLTYAKGDEDNTSTTAMEEYLINDTIYLKVDGNWTALKMPVVADTWSAQNTMTQQLEMLNQSRLTLIGSDMVDGVDCYKVRAEINMSEMADQLSTDVTSLLPMQSMNYSELFHNMDMDVYYWITKDSHLLKKTDVIESFVMAPESLGLDENDSENIEMRINSEVSLLFEGFNESVNVKLPDEAMQAQLFPLGLMVSEAASPVQEGNETMLNETLQNDAMASSDTAQAAVAT